LWHNMCIMIPSSSKILLFDPPGKLYQRGEDRCQADIEGSAAISLRAPNDLGYIAAIARQLGLDPVIRDYPAERLTEKNFLEDLSGLKPSVIIMSATSSTFREDMGYLIKAKAVDSGIITIAKGAFFYECPPEVLDKALASSPCLDIAVSGEAESVISGLLGALIAGDTLESVKGVIYFDPDSKKFKKNPPGQFIEDLDVLPFPARDLMKNDLYVRPDTGSPMATIVTSRGCPEECIYCLSPVISGKKLRARSPKSIIDEVEECVRCYGISDFFFMADTFTMNKPWVIDICREILRRDLKIRWAANSRVKPLDVERLGWMKRAGCRLISLGIESGSPESLAKMKKNASKADAVEAVRMVREAGLKLYAYYMIGFPWEDRSYVSATLNFAREIAADFSEIHIAAPFRGTEQFKTLADYGLKLEDPYGYNYFSNPPIGTKYLSRRELICLRKKGMRQLYMNPAYVFRTLKSIKNFRELMNYLKYGFRLLKNLSQ